MLIEEQQLKLISRDAPGVVRHGAHDTETAAAESVKPITGKQRVAVFVAFAGHRKGLTDYEVSQLCGMRRPHVAGTRREELIALGIPIIKTNERRPTDSGRNAIVWRMEKPPLTPYEWCIGNPTKADCAAAGYCKRNPSCGD